MIGKTLSHFRILAEIGKGGMGVVYKARDQKLRRDVALKVLPPELVGDEERRVRFMREARAAAAVTHQNIAVVHEIDETDGVIFIAMELIEGKTLRSLLRARPLPITDALHIATGIAEGLAIAHKAGVIHRDLKPENIIIGSDQHPKILDFGLAKLLEERKEVRPSKLTQADTLTQEMTQEGRILGTAAYMSPEQARGEKVDARSDIFSFGTTLYEMVTGKRAFEGKNQASLITAIMSANPPPVSTLQPMTPPALDRVVQRCLAKDPEDRWQSARDLTLELKWIAKAGSQASVTQVVAAPRRSPKRLAWWLVGFTSVIAASSLVLLFLQGGGKPLGTVRSPLLPPEESRFDLKSPVAVSPDGHLLAFVASNPEGERMLWVRALDRLVAQPLQGTEGADFPFWSPDGEFLGFFAGGKLKKIHALGGPPITLCDASNGLGGTWNQDGVILFEPGSRAPLYRVSAGGGIPELATVLNDERNEISHRWPHFLPDGRHFLYLARSTLIPESGIYEGSLDSKDSKLVLKISSRMRYAQGFLLFRRARTLVARPFDPDRREFTGEAVPIAPDIGGGFGTWGGAQFSVAENGVLTYYSGGGQIHLSELVWFDRKGNRLGSVGNPANYWNPRLSHDGGRLAVAIGATRSDYDIWVHDLSRNVRTRFTFEPGDHDSPIWSPDDDQIVFYATRKSFRAIYQKVSTGAGDEEFLFPPDKASANTTPTDWSADGRFIALYGTNKETGSDIWVYALAEEGVTPFLPEKFDQRDARFSPDGRWLAYVSNESGREEIYVRSFLLSGGKWQISAGGGSTPTWRGDGKELFYLASDGKLMAVDVRTEPTFNAGVPQPLFDTQTEGIPEQPYDVSSDGQRFLVNTSVNTGKVAATPITLVLNWTAELKK